VAAGVPAAAPRLAHQALGGGSGLQQLPPFPQHLAELPGAAEEWDRNAVFCSVWLGVSSATLALALLVLSLLGIAAGACATIAAATHRFQRCREGLSLADAVHRMLRLAIAAACIAGFISMASALAAFFLSTACVAPARRAPSCCGLCGCEPPWLACCRNSAPMLLASGDSHPPQRAADAAPTAPLPPPACRTRTPCSTGHLPCCARFRLPLLSLRPPCRGAPPARRCPSAHDKDVCARLSGITTLSALWYAFFTGLNAEAAHRAARMRRLLNPVSSGVVTV
jgi:hypothetical protein